MQAVADIQVVHAQIADYEARLEHVAIVFRGASVNYRDAMLEVGRLCAEFVRHGVERGTSAHALRVMLADRLAKEAGRKVHIHRFTCNYYVVQLLGGGDCGHLSWSLLTEFGPFVAHDRKTETWVVAHGKGPEVFRLAVRERWNRERAHNEVMDYFPENRTKYNHRKRCHDDNADPKNILYVIKQADPRDAADVIADILREHRDPVRLMEELRHLVPELM